MLRFNKKCDCAFYIVKKREIFFINWWIHRLHGQCVKYFDYDQETVVTNFLALVQLGKGISCSVTWKMCEHAEFVLPLANLIGIGTDGANNLCDKNHSLYTLLKDKYQNIQLIRCICHSPSNAASITVEWMLATIKFMCREVYNWYSNRPKIRLQHHALK